MIEWIVVTAIIALVGLITAISKPLIKLNGTLTKLNTVVEVLQRDIESLTTRNSNSHNRIWEKNEEQDKRLEDHETRIITLEKHC